jgi:hypothetical protein
MREFKNETNLKFTDISSEKWREYVYDVNKTIFVDKPLQLNVSKSGGHRIFAEDGLSRYIAPGWLEIIWEAKDDQPHFVK